METFHLFHLAQCWGGRSSQPPSPAILSTGPVHPVIISEAATAVNQDLERPLAGKDTVIRAAAVQMVFASRTSQDFITPEEVTNLEHWAGLVRALAFLSLLLSFLRVPLLGNEIDLGLVENRAF